MWWVVACRTEPSSSPTWDRGENPHALDDVLRLNHVQVGGTHNSYHLAPDALVDPSFAYSHLPLDAQLQTLGVRQLELDVHLGADGTWRVFHLPALDDRTTCETLDDCLGALKGWSDAHGWHLPLVVWIEPKDELDGTVDGLVPIGDHLPELDAAILDVWPRDRVYAPDDLRGGHADLPEAVAADGWPLLGGVRGRALFALLDSDAHRETYLADDPTLGGRVMFVDADDPAQPFAALRKDGTPDEVATWVTAGFVVTANGSSADRPDPAGDALLRDAGVHHLATDAPDGSPPRCNPVTAPAACVDAEVERLTGGN